MSSLNDSNDTQEELSAEKKKKFHLVGLLKGLAKFFFGNVWIVLISVILAFVAWFAISVNEFPEIDKSLIGIPIEAEPTDFMKSNNLQIIGDYTGTTDIRISGKRYDISDLKAEDFTAALDLTNVRRAGTYDLSVTIACKNDKVEYSLVENTQMAVTITVDEIAAREFPITASAPDISLPEGYYVDEITSNPPTVTITGSVSVLDEINRVEANASYDGSTLESHEVKTDLTIYKNNGSRLDNSTVKLSTDNVLVNIPILIQKELPLKFRFTGVPQNFDIDTLKYTMMEA